MARDSRAAMAVLPVRLVAAQHGRPAPRATLRAGTLGFVGHATVGEVAGSTSSLSGAVVGDLFHARGWIEAPVATLDTSSALLDRELREMMEAGRHPVLRFDLDSVVRLSTRVESADSLDVLLRGRLTIHGVTRAVALPARVSQLEDGVRVQAAFPIDMADYGIALDSRFFGLLRVRRRVDVRVDVRFGRATRP